MAEGRGTGRRCPASDARRNAQHRRGDVTLVYGARDEYRNQAVVLKEVLEAEVSGSTPGG